MVALTSPAGTRVEVDESLARVLTAQGWTSAEVEAERKPTGRRQAKQ
jgi:hypothetical protein